MSAFLSEFPDEESQTKEIYARFGLAAYVASVFEEGVAIEATILRLVEDLRKGKIKNEAEWEKRHDEEMAHAHSLTLGRGLSRLRSLLALSVASEALFEEALERRNFLLHHFFRDEVHEFYTEAGRQRLHDKLMTMIELFSRADRELMEATSELRHKIGLTDEKLRRAFEELEAEYRAVPQPTK